MLGNADGSRQNPPWNYYTRREGIRAVALWAAAKVSVSLKSRRIMARASYGLLKVAMAVLLCAAGYQWRDSDTAHPFVQDARTHIKHVVIIVQENRSFDNLFHGYPGADWASYGLGHDGKRIPLRPISFAAGYDISHGYRDFLQAYHGGRMDRFDLVRAGRQPGALGKKARVPNAAYGYVPLDETEPYFQMAQRYVLADRMFQSNMDQSFAAHLYLVAGQAAHTVNVPSGRPWGCDATPGARVRTLRTDRTVGNAIFPCFSFRTLADELDEHGLSWRYYAPRVDNGATWMHFLAMHPGARQEGAGLEFGQLWSAFDAIVQVRYGPEWSTNIVSPETTVLHDVAQGDLAAVTWIVPDWKHSDHALSRSATGPDWVASIVNTIGKSRFWRDTAIIVLWDDSGGWYDHVPPPQLDYDGLGDRVPLLVISPYSRHGYVSHTQYEFGSILKFTETIFGLRTLARSDARANNLDECFDFEQPADAFVPIATMRNAAWFFKQIPSTIPPDTD